MKRKIMKITNFVGKVRTKGGDAVFLLFCTN